MLYNIDESFALFSHMVTFFLLRFFFFFRFFYIPDLAQGHTSVKLTRVAIPVSLTPGEWE